MSEKNTNKTFNIDDLCSHSLQSHLDRENNLINISKELEISEMNQDKRLAEKIAKKNYYQKEIENLKNQMMQPLYDSKTNEFLSSKTHLQDSENLSKNLKQIIKEEYDLKSRIAADPTSDHFENRQATDKPLNKINMQSDNDPYKKVFEKKENRNQNEELGHHLSESEKIKLEKKKLYHRYINLLKRQKELIESKDVNENNADLRKILNEISELKKINKKLIKELKEEKALKKKNNATVEIKENEEKELKHQRKNNSNEKINQNEESKNRISNQFNNEKIKQTMNQEIIKNDEIYYENLNENFIKQEKLKKMVEKIKNKVNFDICLNPKKNSNKKAVQIDKKKKGIYCNECDYLLNKGKSTNFCQIHGKPNFKTTIPKRMAMLC